MISIEDLKKLRLETGAGVADVRSALEEAKGDLTKALQIIKQKGLDKADSKAERRVSAGIVEVYSHNGKIGVLVELKCETDFVAKTEDFKALAHELALQIASMNPVDLDDLNRQDYIRDNSKKIADLVKETIAKLGENIQIGRFFRISLA